MRSEAASVDAVFPFSKNDGGGPLGIWNATLACYDSMASWDWNAFWSHPGWHEMPLKLMFVVDLGGLKSNVGMLRFKVVPELEGVLEPPQLM